MLSCGLFADAHYAPTVYGSRRYCRDSLLKLRACVETLNARQVPLAFNLGDLIDTAGDRKADLGLLQEMCTAFGRFRGEKHSVLGNHDLATLTKQEFLQAACSSGCSDDLPAAYGSFDRQGVHFVLLDGNCHQDGSDFERGDFEWDEAWLSPDQIAWLARDLHAARDRRSIVICHENLDRRLREGELDPHVLRNAAAVREVLERAGTVWAVIQAHNHAGMHVVINGIPYVGIAAMVTGEWPDNNAYAVVSLYGDGQLSVEGFGRQESLEVVPRAGGMEVLWG